MPVFIITNNNYSRRILRGLSVYGLIALLGQYSGLQAQCTVNISGNSTYCAGANTTLTANATGSAGYTYLWSNGATTQSIDVSNQGTYSVTVTGQVTGGGTNIIPNGNFSAGNTGFSSDYYYDNSSGSSRDYTVTNNAQVWNSFLGLNYDDCHDITSTSDDMKFLARGSTNSSHRAWYVIVPVTQNTVYDLSAWASAVSSTLLFTSNYALLQIEVNGVLLGSSTRMAGECDWRNLTTTWNSGSSTLATIAIKDLNTTSDANNNFILDDISMIPRTVPGCVISASKNITTVPLSSAEAGIDLAQCNNANFTMAANAPISGAGRWTVVSGTAAISNVNTYNTTVLLTGATATLRWTITNGSCTSTDDITIINNTGVAGLFCNCGPIFGTSYGGTNINYSNQLRAVNTTTGIYSNQIGSNLSDLSAAIALDNNYQRLYYVSNTSNTTIYFVNNSGTSINTGVNLPGSVNYNRTAYNPIDRNLYFVNSDGTNWVRYTPTASGTGGTIFQYTNRVYSPTSAPTLGGVNAGGDIVFDADGNGYLVTNPGHFYKVNFRDATNTATLSYLGKMNLSMSQIAALAFSADGKLFVSGNSNNVYFVDLQTLKETQVNSVTSAGTGDFASCNFPVIRPELQAYKSFKKISGSAGSTIQTNDIVEFTINLQNIGDISASNVKLQDNIPTGTVYINNSTYLNGTRVNDKSGVMPFSVGGGDFVNSFDQAAQSGAVSPVPYSATIKFQVRITSQGNIVRNTGTFTYGENSDIVITNPVEFDVCYPFTGITIGATPFCSGQTTSLTANDEGTYLWNTGATTRSINITTGGTYTVTVTQAPKSSGINLVVNSDFSGGNTGFSSDYINATSGYGAYNITSQANTFFSFALPCPDHDSKTNNMFVVDGSNVVGKRVWYQTIAVRPNTIYDLSAWGQAIIDFNPARLYFAINGTRVGNISTLAALDCAWQQFTTEWHSGSNTSITLAIMNDNIDGSGNDFSIDDISMIPRLAPNCPKVGTTNVSLVVPTPASSGADTLTQCNNTTFALVGNAPTGGEVAYWSVVSGTATIANVNASSTTATVPAGTTAIVRWTIERGGCTTSDKKTLINNLVSVGGVITPTSQTICDVAGNFTTPSVSGIVGNVIRWEMQAPGASTWTNLGGAGSLTAPTNCCANSVGTWRIRAVIQNGVCASTTSPTANIVVNPATTVNINANATTICPYGSVNLTATISPSGAYTYQWQKSTDNTTWTDISGATSSSRTETNITGEVYYRLKVNNGCDAFSTSLKITAYDTAPPILSGVPANRTVSCDNIPAPATPTANDNCVLENIVFHETYSSCSNAALNTNGGMENINNVAMDTTFQSYPAKKLPNYSTLLHGWEMGFPNTATEPGLMVHDNNNTINNPEGNYFMWLPGNSFCIFNNPISLQGGQCVEISLWAAAFSNINPQQSSRILIEVIRTSDNVEFDPYSQVLPASTSFTNMNWQQIVTKFVVPTTGSYRFYVTQYVDPVFGKTPKGIAIDGMQIKNCCDTPPTTCENYTITRTWTARDQTGNATKQSQIITVTDTQAPTFNNAPANVTVCETVPAAPVVTATDNCDATPSVSLTSEVSTKTNNGSCTDNFYTVTRTWTATDNCGNARTAQQVITVLGSFKPTITASPFCVGGTTTLTANLPTCITSANYQWQYYNGTTWVNVGSNNATYTTSSISTNQSYKVIVTVAGSSCTGTADDFIATPSTQLTVNVTTPIGTVCVNSTAILTANVTGGAGTLTYQWQRSTDNSNWTSITNATSATFIIPTASPETLYYRVMVFASGNGCNSATATSIRMIVANNAGCDCVVQSCSAFTKLVFNNATILQDVAGLEGDKWLFTNVATGYDAIVEITKSLNANSLHTVDNTAVNMDDWCPEINWSFIAGEDSYVDWKITIVQAGTRTPANLPSSSRVTSYDVDGNSNYREIHRHINANGFILNNPTELSIESNSPYSTVVGSTTEHTSISTDSEVKATFYYPGQNNVFEIRLGVRTTVAVESASRQYAVSFDPCTTYTSPDIKPQAPEIAGIDTACTGGGATTYTTTQPFVSYNWAVAGGTIISGQGTRTVTVNWATSGAQSVSVTTTDANSCIITKAFSVHVVNPITVSVQPVGFTECIGGTKTLTATVTGGYDLQYQWQSSPDNTNWADIVDANALIYTPLSDVVGATYYRLIVSSASTNCTTMNTIPVTVSIVDDPKVNVTVVSSNICEGGSVTLTANITDASSSCTVQWQRSTTSTPWANIAGATSNSFNTTSLNSTTRYRVVLNCSGSGCCD